MKINDQHRSCHAFAMLRAGSERVSRSQTFGDKACHPERSEGSRSTGGEICMDYPPHHLIYHRRSRVARWPLKGLEAVATMRVKSVFMNVIYTRSFAALRMTARTPLMSCHPRAS